MKELIINIPDLGGVEQASIIEIPIKVGDVLKPNDTIMVLESDKASMEIPTSEGGVVQNIMVAIGDKVSTGTPVLALMSEQNNDVAIQQAASPISASTNSVLHATATPATVNEFTVYVPDLGSVDSAQIIEIPVAVGDSIKENETILVLESEKASVEIPSPYTGVIQKIMVVVGDKVVSHTPVMMMRVEQVDDITTQKSTASAMAAKPFVLSATPVKTKINMASDTSNLIVRSTVVHAGPAVRKLAREFGVDLHLVKPSGPRQRILKEDLQQYVKILIKNRESSSGFDVPSMPDVNFSEFGEIESVEIGRIKKITAINMHRNWVRIPHVTQFDEADITSLEVFRKSPTVMESSQQYDVKLTPLPFIIKAVAIALKKFPQFNASLDPSGQYLILKKYCHIGFAVDTDDGLYVPVIRDADKKTIWELAQNAKILSEKSRNKKLLPSDMKGGCFTISSLGSVGGTAFTPIINAPEVAILGVSRASMKPIYIENAFQPRMMLPLSLSYDHRIIDGAEAARFTSFVAALLADVNQLL